MKLTKTSDIKLLAELASKIWNEYWPKILSQEQINYMVEKFQSQKAIKEQIEKENYAYYFLTVDNKIIGYTGICDKKEYLFLSKLYIEKEFRHKGYGKQAFEEIKKLGFNKIRLTVNKQNKNTIDAYLKYGFKIIDKAVTDIGSGFAMDDFIMEYKKEN